MRVFLCVGNRLSSVVLMYLLARREVNRERLVRRLGGIREKLRAAAAEAELLNGPGPQARPQDIAANPFLLQPMPPRREVWAGYRRVPEPVAPFVPVAQVAPPAVLGPLGRRHNILLSGAEAQDAANSVLGVRQLAGTPALPLHEDPYKIGPVDHRPREVGAHEQAWNNGQLPPNDYGPISAPLQHIPSPLADFGGPFHNLSLLLPQAPLITLVPPRQLQQLQQLPGFPQAGPGAPYPPQQPQPPNPVQQVRHQHPLNYISNIGFPQANREPFGEDLGNWVEIERPREWAGEYSDHNVILRDGFGGGSVGGGGGEERVYKPRRP